MICGGIDLGGTKIEARLFDGPEAETVETRRVPTPSEDFASMIEAACAQIAWLRERAGDPGLPVGVAVPGVIDPVSGITTASNIPATGHSLPGALAEALGEEVPVVNDCMAFAYSEAHGGAGDGARSVMGLTIGTGLGGGLAVDGKPAPRHAGLAVEIGHVSAPARAVARHGLPLFACGCGRMACMETYFSGTGIANLSEALLGQRHRAEDLVAGDSTEARQVMAVWSDLAGECLDTIQLLLDPDCIVLGGGLSRVPGMAERLTEALAAHRLGAARSPRIVVARHGDSSGARGAALMATRGG